MSRAEKKVNVKVLRPFMIGSHVIPAQQGEGDTKKAVVIELAATHASQLMADRKVALTTDNKNYELPIKAKEKEKTK